MIKRPTRHQRARRGAQQGATAVEFAMVAFPLFLIIMATLELAMVFVVSTMLEGALSRAAREIRTGQQQNSTDVSSTAFKAEVCSQMVFLKASCAGNLTIDVRGGAQFSSAGAPDPIVNGAFDSSQMTFVPGGPSTIVLVRAFYRWPLFTPLLNEGLSKLNGQNTAVITATDTFRNEPYTS